MRKFFAFLIMLVFVGGHGFSDVAAHVQVNIENGVYSVVSTTDNSATKDDASKDGPVGSSSSLHCAAYCGLMATAYIGVYPDTKADLFEHHVEVSKSISISDHFRPPIA